MPPQGDEAPGADLMPAPAAWSEEELLREKDFAAYTDAERAMARRLLARIALRGPKRRSRRTVPTTRRRDEHDLRATIRASLRTGGELLERRYREQAMRPRRLVLICDVSRLDGAVLRMLLQYMQACVAARARVEAFVFGTRLTRVTRELRGRDSDRALAAPRPRSTTGRGGTRIGEAIAQLNREHGRRIGRGSMVILLSDGWDRGEPEELAEEMARLQRTAYRVVWLNPLAADPRYEPLTRGMKAAMPHVDRLLPGNSIASLEALAELMEAGTSHVARARLSSPAGAGIGVSAGSVSPFASRRAAWSSVSPVPVSTWPMSGGTSPAQMPGSSLIPRPNPGRGQGCRLSAAVGCLGAGAGMSAAVGPWPSCGTGRRRRRRSARRPEQVMDDARRSSRARRSAPGPRPPASGTRLRGGARPPGRSARPVVSAVVRARPGDAR